MSGNFSYDNEKIVFEVLDNELVLVNLENGYYYVMQGAAVDIWQQLTNGKTLEETLETFIGRYPSERDRIEKTIPAFVEQLREEGLIVEEPDGFTNSGGESALQIQERNQHLLNLLCTVTRIWRT